MNIHPIRTKQDHKKALDRASALMQATSQEDLDELEILATLIESYEEQHYHISTPNAVDAIKFRMEQEGLKQKDLAFILGDTSRVARVLSGQRKLTVEMIRKLHLELNIPFESLMLGTKG